MDCNRDLKTAEDIPNSASSPTTKSSESVQIIRDNMDSPKGEQNSVPSLPTNSTESVHIKGHDTEERSDSLPQFSVGKNGDFNTAGGTKEKKKYVDDEEFKKSVKDELSKYIGKNDTLEEVLLRIRDNEQKGYATRIKGCQEIQVSEFLTNNFCKDKKISRFVLMTDDKKNGLSCDSNERGIRCYKVQNGPPVVLTINWYVDGKKCTLEIELGTEGHLKVIKCSEDLSKKELAANKEVRINGKALVEVL